MVVADVPAEDTVLYGVDHSNYSYSVQLLRISTFILRPAVIPVNRHFTTVEPLGVSARAILGLLCGDIVTAGRVAAVPEGGWCRSRSAAQPDRASWHGVRWPGIRAKLHLAPPSGRASSQSRLARRNTALAFDTGVIQGDPARSALI